MHIQNSESHMNEDVYLERLAFINVFIEKTEYSCIYIFGNLNADISDRNCLFGRHLIEFCDDNKFFLLCVFFFYVVF